MAGLFMDAAANSGSKAILRAKLETVRAHTLAVCAHLTPDQLQVPYLATVNPPLWELGHIAWFEERWCRRTRPGRAPPPSRYPHFDAWYNSSVIPHAERWRLPHPPRAAVLEQMQATRDDALQALEGADESLLYYFELSALHEAMHSEALLMTLQTLALPAPPRSSDAGRDVAPVAAAQITARDIEFGGGEFPMGTAPGATRFLFDNEKWAHPVRVAPFAMANRCVTNGEFARFVDAGGYDRREWWSETGWAWRTGTSAAHPVYWRRDGATWQARRNERWQALDEAQPAMHVNLHEAEAWCAWARRRLPTEAEWEFAARAGGGPATYPWGEDAALLDACTLGYRTDGPTPAGVAMPELGPLAHLIGNVWEWTATPFEPYPGFGPDPYADYSAPWFGDHTVLRGASFATAPWLIHNRFRNFYLPHRSDVFVGFRTCAPG